MSMNNKCLGVQLIIAGILFGLVAFKVFSAWLNLPLVLGIIAIIAGIHAFGCKCDSQCCEMPKEKSKKK